MTKRPQALSVALEGRFENFSPIRRDFNVVVENKSEEKLVGGIVGAKWADPAKTDEKFMPAEDQKHHAFGPSPATLIVYVESAESFWSALLNVDGYNGATLTLHGAQ